MLGRGLGGDGACPKMRTVGLTAIPRPERGAVRQNGRQILRRGYWHATFSCREVLGHGGPAGWGLKELIP